MEPLKAAIQQVQQDVDFMAMEPQFQMEYLSQEVLPKADPSFSQLPEDMKPAYIQEEIMPQLAQTTQLGNLGGESTNFLGDLASHFTNAATGYQRDDLLQNSGNGLGATLGDLGGALATIGGGALGGSALGATTFTPFGVAAGGIGGGIASAATAGTLQDLQAQRLEGAINPNYGRALGSGVLQGGLQAIPGVGQGLKLLPRVGLNTAIQGAGGGLGSLVQQGIEQGSIAPNIDWNRVKAEAALGGAGGAVSGVMHGKGQSKKSKVAASAIDDPDAMLKQYETQRMEQAKAQHIKDYQDRFKATMRKVGLDRKKVQSQKTTELNAQYVDLTNDLSDPNLPPDLRKKLENLQKAVVQQYEKLNTEIQTEKKTLSEREQALKAIDEAKKRTDERDIKQAEAQRTAELRQLREDIIARNDEQQQSQKEADKQAKQAQKLIDEAKERTSRRITKEEEAQHKQNMRQLKEDIIARNDEQQKAAKDNEKQAPKPKIKLKKKEDEGLKASLREIVQELEPDKQPENTLYRSDKRQPDEYDKMAARYGGTDTKKRYTQSSEGGKVQKGRVEVTETQPTKVGKDEQSRAGTKKPNGKKKAKVKSRKSIKAHGKQAYLTGETVLMDYSAEGGYGQANENRIVKSGTAKDGRTKARKIGGEDLDKEHRIRRETIVSDVMTTKNGEGTYFKTIDENGQFRTRIIEGKGQKSRINWMQLTGEASPYRISEDGNTVLDAGTGKPIDVKTNIEAEHTSVVESKLRDIVERVNSGKKVNSREIMNVTKEKNPKDIESSFDKMGETTEQLTLKVDC